MGVLQCRSTFAPLLPTATGQLYCWGDAMQQDKRGSRGKGRPRIDDEDQILAFFMAQIAQGMSISEIAAKNLAIWDIDAASRRPQLIRQMKKPLLERRYRQILAKRIREFERSSEAVQCEGARCIGIPMPNLPLSMSHRQTLKRGRPKNKRGN